MSTPIDKAIELFILWLGGYNPEDMPDLRDAIKIAIEAMEEVKLLHGKTGK